MSGVQFARFGLATCLTGAIVFAGVAQETAFARGGGGHGGHHGGGHHGGHHAGHHGHHPYHPSHHHTAHHDHRHDHHHYHHHHHSWHNGGWGPGFWGGLGLGALGGWYGGNYWGGGWGGDGGYYGGDTYVNNSSTTPTDSGVQNAASIAPSAENPATSPADDTNLSQQGQTAGGFPVDDWPELGVVTYAGEYGGKQGIVVVRVVPNSAAAKAGVVPGDVILKLNEQPTPNADALEAVLDSAKGNFDATVWDARTGRISTLNGTLDPSSPDLREQGLTPAQSPTVAPTQVK